MLCDDVDRVLDHFPYRLQEPGTQRAIDDPVVAAHGQTHARLHHPRAVHDHHLLLHRADRDDAGFGWIDDRRELDDAEHAEVADRERRARVLFGLELLLARTARELFYFHRDVAHAFAVRVAHDRRDQTVFDRDRDADVHARVTHDHAVAPRRIDVRMARERSRDRLDHEVVDRRLDAVFLELLVDALAQLHHARHVNFDRQVERRYRPDRLRQPLRDRLPHLRYGHFGARLRARVGTRTCGGRRRARRSSGRRRGCTGRDRRLRGGRSACILDGGLDVTPRDATARSRAFDRRQLDARFERHLLRERRRLDAAAVAVSTWRRFLRRRARGALTARRGFFRGGASPGALATCRRLFGTGALRARGFPQAALLLLRL